MENKYKSIVIIVTALIALIGGIYVFQNKEIKTPQNQTTTEQNIEVNSIEHKNNENAQEILSEQPNKEKFNEYFKEAYLAKISTEEKYDPLKAVNAKSFSTEDQFCTSLKVKKTIPANHLSWIIYDIKTNKDIEPKNTTPIKITSENGFGCTKLTYPAGKYEQKIYIDNVLVIVLPFEIK